MTSMKIETPRSDAIHDVARNQLGISTLATRGSDRLDFHEVGVTSLANALAAAFDAGVEYGEQAAYGDASEAAKQVDATRKAYEAASLLVNHDASTLALVKRFADDLRTSPLAYSSPIPNVVKEAVDIAHAALSRVASIQPGTEDADIDDIRGHLHSAWGRISTVKVFFRHSESRDLSALDREMVAILSLLDTAVGIETA